MPSIGKGEVNRNANLRESAASNGKVKQKVEKGEKVTDKNGSAVTEQVTVKPTIKGDGTVIVGTSAVPVTDGLGNTAVDNQGNIFTTIIKEILNNPLIFPSTSCNRRNLQYNSRKQTIKR